jgi:hypothetical protein
MGSPIDSGKSGHCVERWNRKIQWVFKRFLPENCLVYKIAHFDIGGVHMNFYTPRD